MTVELEDSAMEHATREMARRCYGYGRWDAPYWFIGPEQGQGKNENNELKERVKAWLHFGSGELTDCRVFHEFINEDRFHGEHPQLQRTWGPLISLSMAYLEKRAKKLDLLNYQRDRWGRISNGETCVIELSGLPANNFRVPRDREQYREERIEVIRQRLREYQPQLVVMYGKGGKKHWAEIAGRSMESGEILTIESTTFAFTPHPNLQFPRGDFWKDKDWAGFGERLRPSNRS